MAATEKKQMWFYGSTDGSFPVVRDYPIDASEGIFMPGAPCYISTSGTVKLATTTALATDKWSGFIVGLSNQSSTWPLAAELATNTLVRVALIEPTHYYAAYAENNGTDCSCAQTLVGDLLGMKVSSTTGQIGYTTVDVSLATNTVVEVMDLMSNVEPEKFTTSTSPGVLIVRFLTANTQASKA